MKVLNVRTQQPIIEMETQKGQLEMSTPQVVMDIDHGATEVNIHTIPAELNIDQYPSRASYGILSTEDRISRTYRMAKQEAKDGIARRAEEGRQFLESAHVGQVIANQERTKLFEMPAMQVGLCQVTPPTIQYTPSQVQLDVKTRPVSLTVDAQPVDINYTPPQVHIYLKQKSDVQMWVSEYNYNIYA